MKTLFLGNHYLLRQDKQPNIHDERKANTKTSRQRNRNITTKKKTKLRDKKYVKMLVFLY